MFCNSTGEEEDPGGGDPLSAGGLCAVGLLRCPRKGKHSFLSFTLFICLSSLFHQRLHYWLTHLYCPICTTRRECIVCLFVYIFMKVWHSDSVHMQRDCSMSSENKKKEPFLPYKWEHSICIAPCCCISSYQLTLVVTPAYELSDYCDRASHPIQAKMDSFLWITHWNCEDEVKFHILFINLSWETLNVFFCCRWLLPIAQSRIFVSNNFCQEFIYYSVSL